MAQTWGPLRFFFKIGLKTTLLFLCATTNAYCRGSSGSGGSWLIKVKHMTMGGSNTQHNKLCWAALGEGSEEEVFHCMTPQARGAPSRGAQKDFCGRRVSERELKSHLDYLFQQHCKESLGRRAPEGCSNLQSYDHTALVYQCVITVQGGLLGYAKQVSFKWLKIQMS